MNDKFEINLNDVLASFKLDSIDVPENIIASARSKHASKGKVYVKMKGISDYNDKRRDR